MSYHLGEKKEYNKIIIYVFIVMIVIIISMMTGCGRGGGPSFCPSVNVRLCVEPVVAKNGGHIPNKTKLKKREPRPHPVDSFHSTDVAHTHTQRCI